ncbi:hypothetical protein [Nocardioides panzhihuensis]|uniref:Uncharacterized protein n=1 Tax=Nocardioides panzhihuensis TaxID=860243 RepID=A0A7Z0DT81_9ACTN|nr:hypothetical protein [Nocardioides panzhihuensis]NYI81233.1 hypothetical protein [Nocardioides panzhihuensis]
MEEVTREMGGKTAAALQVALAAAEQIAIRRARALATAQAESETRTEQVRRQLQAEAELAAGAWAAAAKAGPDWIDGYASAVAHRELDPRAAQAAAQIEEQLRARGIDVPDTSRISEANKAALEAGYAEDLGERAAHREDAETHEERARDEEARAAAVDEREQAEESVQSPAEAEHAEPAAEGAGEPAHASRLADESHPQPVERQLSAWQASGGRQTSKKNLIHQKNRDQQRGQARTR